MFCSSCLPVNCLAVMVSSVVFFIIGSIWFSALVGKIWRRELELHNVVIKEPTAQDLTMKMILTFLANIVASFAMAYLVQITGSHSLVSGFWLGCLVALGFVAPAIASMFVWESRSLKLFLLDLGYPAIGVIVIAMILSIWR